MRGVSLDSNNPAAGMPSMTQLGSLAKGPHVGHRLVVFDDVPFYAYYHALEQAGFGRALLLTGQSMGPTDTTMYLQCRRYARVLRPSLWIIGNEWNIPGDASWPVGEDAMVAVWNECASAIRMEDSQTPLFLGGLFCGYGVEAEIASIWPKLNPTPDGVDLHPYQATPDLAAIRAAHGCQICIGEWNDSGNTSGIGSYQAQIDRETDHSFWFCWSDGMVAPMGLVTASGRRNPAYAAYRAALIAGGAS